MRAPIFVLCALSLGGAEFRSQWPAGVQRPWAGPEYWANPMQDWRIRDGRLECFVAGEDRNVFLLTREVSARSGNLELSVRVGPLDAAPDARGFVGFRLGINGQFRDYRDSAVRGTGMNAGLALDGRLFIGRLEEGAPRLKPPFDNVELRLTARPGAGGYDLLLAAYDASGRKLGEAARKALPPARLEGGLALVCHSGEVAETLTARETSLDPAAPGTLGKARRGAVRYWFRDWRVSGDKVDAHDNRAFGPILWTMHTLSRRVLKLTAQMAPVETPAAPVRLEVRQGAGWREIARAAVDPLSRTATFRIPDWDASRDIPYRVVYRLGAADFTWSGAIRRDPVAKPKIVVAAFTGNNDLGFPHADIVRHVSHFRPDFLAYTGDNIYERVGDYGIQRAPVETATLDYLRKWYLFGWEYRELLKDTPAVCLPDDHDVYHGNLWGAGGRLSKGEGYAGQDPGGYVMPVEWVNMVQRTQTSHHPDPYDPTPVPSGITVYYGPLLYGGISFAVLEDRKWKSAPSVVLPQAKIVNGWAQSDAYNAARDGDAPGAQLLGERQEKFLEEWAADWSGGAWMKVVVSQTIFANVATLPKGSKGDQETPKLRVTRPGEYAEGDAPVADHDSNGWPQTPRNRALRAMRRGFAFHIAGDQHLGSTIQYGIDEFNDASWALCVPSVANVWPRRWFPPQPGANRKPGAPRYAGEFLDGFGNRMTVHAVSNPTAVDVQPTALFHRAPGFGLVEFDRATRKITIANWPRWVDPAAPGAKPYDHWPITIGQLDNGFPHQGLSLGEIALAGLPVLQVIEEATGEIQYTLRPITPRFIPRVRRPGAYTVRRFDPDRPGREQVLRSVRAR